MMLMMYISVPVVICRNVAKCSEYSVLDFTHSSIIFNDD